MSERHSTRGRAGAYYRMSDVRQENSIERQKSQVLPYAEKHGYAIVRDYVDEAIAGDEIARRKAFQRMLQDAQLGVFDVILCDDKDRFGRFDSIDLGEIVAPLRRKGVWVETVAQGRIDWETFAGRMSDAIMQEAKLIEQTAISRRVLSQQLLKAQKGIPTGGRAAYGYRWEPDLERGKRLVPDGRKADVVRLIFRLYDEGLTLFAIAEELFRRGVPSPRGRLRWTRPVIQRVLTNRRYTGDWTWGVHPQGKRHRATKDGITETTRARKRSPRRGPSADWIVRPGSHEPLVEREAFERVQARLAGNKTLTTPHPNGGNFALGRLLVCAHCGSFLVGLTEYGNRRYVCSGYLAYGKGFCNKNAIAEKAVTKLLATKLQEAYLDPVHLHELRSRMASLEAEQRSEGSLRQLGQQADTLDRQIKEGNERLLILPPDRLPGVIAKLREMEAQRDALRESLRRAQTDSPVADLEEVIATAEGALWRLQEAVRAEDVPLLRQLLHELVERVELHWTHEVRGKITRASFSWGEIVPRTGEEVLRLSPSASRTRQAIRFTAAELDG